METLYLFLSTRYLCIKLANIEAAMITSSYVKTLVCIKFSRVKTVIIVLLDKGGSIITSFYVKTVVCKLIDGGKDYIFF